MKTILSFTSFINESNHLSEHTLKNLVTDVNVFDTDQYTEYCNFIEELQKKPLWSLQDKIMWDAYIKEDDLFVVINFDTTNSPMLPFDSVGIIVDKKTSEAKDAYWGNDAPLDLRTADNLLNLINFGADSIENMAIRDLTEYERNRRRN